MVGVGVVVAVVGGISDGVVDAMILLLLLLLLLLLMVARLVVMVRRRRYLQDFAGVSDNERMWIGTTTVRMVRISPPKDSNRIIDDDERSVYS